MQKLFLCLLLEFEHALVLLFLWEPLWVYGAESDIFGKFGLFAWSSCLWWDLEVIWHYDKCKRIKSKSSLSLKLFNYLELTSRSNYLSYCTLRNIHEAEKVFISYDLSTTSHNRNTTARRLLKMLSHFREKLSRQNAMPLQLCVHEVDWPMPHLLHPIALFPVPQYSSQDVCVCNK